MPTKKTITKKAPVKKAAPAKKAVKKAAKAPQAPKAPKAEVSAEVSKVADIAQKLREFRFGAAGSKAKNTSLPRAMRKTRAQLLTAERALAISQKKA